MIDERDLTALGTTAGGTGARGDAWVAAIQQVLDGFEGNHALLLPVRGEDGEIVDFRFAAAGAGAVDAYGRTGHELVGLRLRRDFAPATPQETWEGLRALFRDGGPRSATVPFPRAGAGLPPAWFTTTVWRVGDGLLVRWGRADDPGELGKRITRTERMAGLGWGEQDLGNGSVRWSDELYEIFAREPAQGPLTWAGLEEATVPPDRPAVREARGRVTAGEPADITVRVRANGAVRHVRLVAEVVADVQGRPLKTVAVVQDVTTRVTSGAKLATMEQQLTENQANLAAQSRLAAELQQIILPIPASPIDLSGLRVAVRYLPAEQANRIGGDWYFADTAADGSVVIAVGDVAGHGIRAAAAMAQQRNAVATLTATGTTEPADLLRQLNRLTYAGDDPAAVASAVVARYDPATGVLRWAQAGHPAPLRARAGTTVELARPAGILLGVVPEPVYETITTTIRPGELLLLYTDGLIEYRDQRSGDGLTPVVETLNRLTVRHSPQPLAGLLAQLRQANPDDDTCIVAFRRLSDAASPEPDRVTGRGGR